MRKFLKLLSDLEDSQSTEARELLRGTIVQYLKLAAEKVESAVLSGQAEDARHALTDLDRLQEFVERLAKLEIEVYSEELKAKQFRAAFDSIRALAEAIKIPADVEEVMKDINFDLDITEKVDQALILLDNIKRARKLSGNRTKILCRNVLIEGKIYQNLLENNFKARECYKEVIALGQTFTTEKWYQEAQSCYQVLIEKLDKSEEDNKDEIREELAGQIKLLDRSAKMSFSELINFLFEKFPPKHKPNAERPKMKDVNNPGQKKRAYYILCSFYHPDKIDANKHGMIYKVLCEEISKRINERSGNM